MAAGRVAEGVGLKSIKVVSRDKFVQTLALKLKEYVSHVEWSPRVALVSDDCGGSVVSGVTFSSRCRFSSFGI